MKQPPAIDGKVVVWIDELESAIRAMPMWGRLVQRVLDRSLGRSKVLYAQACEPR